MKPERIRIMSKQTRIYHRPTCRYVKRIQKRNLLETGVFEAKAFGYQPCLCCNTIEHVYETEQNYLKYFFRSMKLEFSFIKDAVYVKTPISLWKLVYSKQDEKFILFHRNHSKMPVNYEDPSSERFHRQEDCAKANSIAALGKYIYHQSQKPTSLPQHSFSHTGHVTFLGLPRIAASVLHSGQSFVSCFIT